MDLYNYSEAYRYVERTITQETATAPNNGDNKMFYLKIVRHLQIA